MYQECALDNAIIFKLPFADKRRIKTKEIELFSMFPPPPPQNVFLRL